MEKSNLKNLNEGSEKTSTSRQEAEYSKTLRCGKRTYFFDIKTTKTGDKYLVVTESKWEGGDERKRNNILVFEEDINNFKEIIEEATDYIKGKK